MRINKTLIPALLIAVSLTACSNDNDSNRTSQTEADRAAQEAENAAAKAADLQADKASAQATEAKESAGAAVDAAGGHWADDSSWLNQLCLQLLYLMGVRQSGHDHASPPVWSYDGHASLLF